MAGRSPRALYHEALLFSGSAHHPSPPSRAAPWAAERLRTAGSGSLGRMDTVGFSSLLDPNTSRIRATTDIHHLPFQEGSTPAYRLMTGLADQTLCLHRLLKKKEKRKPWAVLKRLYCKSPSEQNSLYITPGRRRARSPGDPDSVRKAGVGLTRSSRGEEGPVHIKGSDPGS